LVDFHPSRDFSDLTYRTAERSAEVCHKKHGWRMPYRTAERSAEVMSSFPVLRFGVGFLLSHNE